MSFSVKKILQFPQGTLNYVPSFDTNADFINDSKLLGGVLKDKNYVWQAKGPVLILRNTRTGCKVGEWVFGGIIRDSNTKIVCVEEYTKLDARISLLFVAIESIISGGIICIFDVFSSQVIRAIQIKEKITSLHLIDPGIEHFPEALRFFDGVLALGTDGGDVFLLDICRQICELTKHGFSKKDERNPSQMVLLTEKHMANIDHYREKSLRDGNHISIHLNAVFDNRTEHFVLKGPKGDDRIHVNKEEVQISSIYYCPQLGSLLVGYNFGAFQLWDLAHLKLVYTSPVCEVHFPITNFALQEPTDDPRAFCYVWVSYSNTELLQARLPFAVMYSFCFKSKDYHEGYGYLYQDFQYCTIRYQMELGQIEGHRTGSPPKGGCCLSIQPITKLSMGKELSSHYQVDDTLALCLITWTVWFSKSNTQTCLLLFDLNQWYKEQMPSFTKWKDCTNYILRTSLSDLVSFNGYKHSPTLNVLLDETSLTQFTGVQRLEEHFYPSSLSFDLWILRESDVILSCSEGLQKSLISQIVSKGPLCLVRPGEFFKQAITLGLTPLFVDITPSKVLSIELQREIILNIALEHRLTSWLCKCASEWANGSFSSAGCSLDFLITWAFQRAVNLKTNCDKFCASLFDYSQSRLDANASNLLISCARQIDSLSVLYKHISGKLASYVGSMDLVNEQGNQLDMTFLYYEIIRWLVTVGLLPECPYSAYPLPVESDKINAPYPVHQITEYYIERRAELSLLNKDACESSDGFLFIDNLISRKCGGSRLQTQWQEDGGSGLYPPPSLQSLVRTYLVDASTMHKHSLVIYLFLDLAATLDERYSSVVEQLIKFPAVFKVPPGIVKITHAFWQLDHGDFAAAMEQFLNPSVSGEDFQAWHHHVAMTSLLIQKQPKVALQYMQARKPPVTNENDIMTALSLFVANSMLDEAFYFKNAHKNNNEEKLLMHLFHECRKNNSIHRVLYKSLSDEEERIFFKYLKSAHNPASQDLQIYYYLFRSRFIEAYDAHSVIRRSIPDRQGLKGQSLASETDLIIKIFKSLMPDVNRNLVEFVRKERNILWKEVKRPTPMSVFVHNSQEQVQYKSSLIYAALSKAKHTFQNGFNETLLKELTTEDIPFLRTPTASRNRSKLATPVITPKIIDNNSDEDLDPPIKRRKLSPRMSISKLYSPQQTDQHISITPIVKRKISFQQQSPRSLSNVTPATPQSILKVRPAVQRKSSPNDMIDEDAERTRSDLSYQNISLRIQSRTPVSHNTNWKHVQFEEATRSSLSLSDQSAQQMDNTMPTSSVSSKNLTTASDDLGEGSDEVFLSADNSAENTGNNEVENKMENPEPEDINVIKENQADEKKEVTPPKEINISASNLGESRSPRGRRSYKRSLGELSPTRSSPRLSKLYSKNSEEEEQNKSERAESSPTEKPTSNSESTSSDSLSPKTRVVPKLKGRKSLSRQVLEHNTFSKIHSPMPEVVVSKEVSFTKSEKITVTEKSEDHSKLTTVESNLKSVDTSTTEKNTPNTRKSHSFSSSVTKKQFLEETLDSDSSLGSFQFEEQNEQEQLSTSLQEYIYNLMSSANKLNQNSEKDRKLPKVQLNFEDEPVDEEINEEKEFLDPQRDEQNILHGNEAIQRDEEKDRELPKVQLTFEDEPVEEEINEGKEFLDTQRNEEKILHQNEAIHKDEAYLIQEKNVEPYLEENEVIVNLDEQEPLCETQNTVGEEVVQLNIEEIQDFVKEPEEAPPFITLEPVQMEYDVTTSLEAELLPSNKAYDIYDVEEDYREMSDEESSFNELENNIFGVVGEEFSQTSQSNRSSDHGSSDVPEAEKAYIADNDVVLISSSEDEHNPQDSNTSSNSEEHFLNKLHDPNSENSYNSDYSKTTEDILDTSYSESNEENAQFIEDHAEKQDEFDEDQMQENEAQIMETGSKENVEENCEKLVLTEKGICEDSGISEQTLREATMTEHVNSAEVVKENADTGVLTNKLDISIVQDEIVKPSEEEVEIVVPSSLNVSEEDSKVEDKSIQSAKQSLPKVDSSTNTTTLGCDETVKDPAIDKDAEKQIEEDLRLNVDQSTNTTIVEDNKSLEKHIADKDSVEEKSEKSEQIPERKTYPSRSKKTDAEDHTTSSSDTTEGESFRNEVVTVEVHTSDKHEEQTQRTKALNSDKKKEEQVVTPDVHTSDNFNKDENHASDNPNTNLEKKPVARRVTRKNSASAQIPDIDVRSAFSDFERKEVVIELSKDDIFRISKDHAKQSGPTLDKRARRARSETPARTSRKDQIEQDKIDCDPNESLKLVEDSKVVKLILGRKRSASVDEVRTFSRQKTSKQNTTVDEEVRENNSEIIAEKDLSSAHMPVISEEVSIDLKPKSKKAKSVLDSYTTSRRLTRRQANIVKDITSFTKEKEETMPTVSLEVEAIDPMSLLLKDPFEGKPDPEEKMVYETSPPSTSTNRRRSRSNSVISDVSTTTSQNLPTTPTRGGRSTRSQTRSPGASGLPEPPSPTPTRNKKRSRSNSVASEVSTTSQIEAKTPERTNRSTRSQTKSPVASGVSTRSRKHSETSASEISEPSTPPKRSAKKKLDDDQVGTTTRSARSRSASVSSAKSGGSNSSKKGVKRGRVVSTKSDLPEIREENVAENVDEVSSTDKRKQTRRKT